MRIPSPRRQSPRRGSLRLFHAIVRDAQVVLRETGGFLLALLGVWLSFGLLLWQLYRPEGEMLSLSTALYFSLEQMLFEPLPFPAQWYLQPFFFLVPAVALGLIASGALNAGLLLFNKRTRQEAWQMALASTYNNHIIVCGLGKVGYRMVGQLQAAGEEVVVIQRTKESEFYDIVAGGGVPVIIGDARQVEMLERAGLRRARSICVVTNDDLTNLDIALTAREIRPEMHIVMRVFNDALARKLSTAFNIKTAFSTSALAAPTFAAAAISREVRNAIYVGGQFLVTMELDVVATGVLDGKTVVEIEQSHNISVLFRQNKQGQDLRPRPEEILRPNDHIVLIGALETLQVLCARNVPTPAR